MRYKKKKNGQKLGVQNRSARIKKIKKGTNKENGNNKKEGKKRSGMKTISGEENLRKKNKNNQ